MCDINIFIPEGNGSFDRTITSASIVDLTREFFDEIRTSHSRIVTALWWEALVSAAIQREWTMSLGQRTATERMAHLLCEIFFRLRQAPMARCWQQAGQGT